MFENRILINKLYSVETFIKVVFIATSPFNMFLTLFLGVVASGIGILRVFKTPQMNKQYLQKVLMNNHGQNILYISFGIAGRVNFLFYAPICLFFAYGIAEYVKINYPQNKYMNYVDMVRENRAKIFETKGIL